MGSAAPRVYVMYQNISEQLTADYLIAYKVLPTASRIYFHQKSTTLLYVLEDIQFFTPTRITFVNALLFPDVYFVFVDH